MNVITKTVSLPDGRTISIETGKLAKQADGAVMLRMNNTVLLATVCGISNAIPARISGEDILLACSAIFLSCPTTTTR